ncbi:TadE/TadG family type IV pilus assembly protein [Erythrobacter donghaensis]|jgi:Flp pilus assembly protein TadG|uniref:TadE/TadG family type IV pilus assembly protein n=1 Tax=Erythrobacter donghaensis TaxID=267135 RepID=UPI00093B0374|nr:TadE/TadG family type IV pilus assembly protein [Erythrobacter donghaensis]
MIRRRLFIAHAVLRQLRRNREGVTLVEFAIVGPVLILMLMGLFDIAHTQYTSAVLHGAMQKAARDYTLESAAVSANTIDTRVQDQIRTVMPNGATITFTRSAFDDFKDVNEPEPYTDMDNNGRCNNGEPYEDANNNSIWDVYRGQSGIGTARDVMLFTTNVSYPRLFPMFGMIGLPANVTLSASTVLRRQPFDQGSNINPTVRNCT